MPLNLRYDQRQRLLDSITYRTSQFPQGTLLKKLEMCDEAYHLARIIQSEDMDPKNPDNAQIYSRYEELNNALAREVSETLATKLVTTFFSKPQIFAMTSHPDRVSEASQFNVILEDQQKENDFRGNLMQVAIDVAKYNLAAVDVQWITKLAYNLEFNAAAAPGKRVTRGHVAWSGNAIQRVDPYNFIFDTAVHPSLLHTKGEFAGYVTQYTQVGLKELIDTLKSDAERSVYLDNPEDSTFNLFNVATAKAGGPAGSASLKFNEPKTITMGSEATRIAKRTTDWSSFFGSDGQPAQERMQHYTVFKCYMRVNPKAYTLKTPTAGDILNDTQEIWEIHILDGAWILATKKLDNVHGMLPILVAQTDKDSLSYNTTGPMQIAIPYQKTAKQLMDRVLASSDRAIGDRAIYDENHLDETAINSRIPEAKIKLKKTLTNGKTIDSIFRQIPFQGNDVLRLYDNISIVESAGRRAAGFNAAQAGQFVPGNKTLFEYSDIIGNADDKNLVRALILEAVFMQPLKYMLKLNIIQFQDRATLYSTSEKIEINVNPADLYQARVDFALADALMPTTHLISPNVQQLLLQIIQTNPNFFAGYDQQKMVIDVVGQSNGFDLQKYKLDAPTQGQGGVGAQP